MKILKVVAITGFLLFSARSFATSVEVKIHGLRHTTGAIILNLFTSPSSWDSETPDKVIQISSLKGTETMAAMDLPEGTYAFFLYHDVDGNGELKRGAFGLPGEPYAFSNNLRIGFSKPTFDKMKFTVDTHGAIQEIQLVNP